MRIVPCSFARRIIRPDSVATVLSAPGRAAPLGQCGRKPGHCATAAKPFRQAGVWATVSATSPSARMVMVARAACTETRTSGDPRDVDGEITAGHEDALDEEENGDGEAGEE